MSLETAAILALSVATDMGLAWLLVLRRRGPPLAVADLRLGALTLLLFTLLKGAAAVLAWRIFLAVRLVHGTCFLAAPLLGAAAALGWPRPATRAARWTAGLLALALAAVGLYSSHVEPFALRTEVAVVEVAPERAGRSELRIGVLADLQCTEVGDHERAAVARVMELAPDLILIPGDLAQLFTMDAWTELQPSLRALLATLRAPLGVFAVEGNCDPPGIARALLEGTGVRFLHDETVELRWRDRRITLAGIQLDVHAPAAGKLLAKLCAPGGDDLRIVMAHVPDVALVLPPGGRVDLVVAGHTHGGQVQLPWLGPLITLSAVPRAVAAGGLHVVGGTQLYVSRGIGVERGEAPRVRFLCPPEVSLLTLRTAERARRP